MNAIYTKNLSKKFKDIIAVDNLNLSVNEGELFSLLGVNGAGKSTTIKMLTCLIKPTSGDAEVLGNNIVSDEIKVKNIVNVSPQETAIAPNLTVKENIYFFAEVYGVDKSERETRINNIIEEFKLNDILNRRAEKLSGGWQRRLSIAIALVTNPKVLFLDEPTLGLDVLARRELWSVIRALKGKVTVILTTHYMEEAEELSDRIGIMNKGKLITVGTAEELIKSSSAKNFEDAFVKIATEGV